MLSLRVIQAQFGDCFILKSGYGKRRKHVLVDGGPSGVYKQYLRDELKKIAADGGRLDLVVLSHVDGDHILGLLEFMKALKDAQEQGLAPLVQVSGMWHNGFSKILPEAPEEAYQVEVAMANEPDPPPEEPAAVNGPTEPSPEAELWGVGEPFDYGIKEGHMLQLLDSELHIPRNPALKDRLITVENASRPIRAAGMRLWILGPRQEHLDRLRKKWIAWLEKQGLSYDITVPRELIKPDTSEANLSSIMFLAESGRRRILMTGDGLGDDVVAGLEETGLLSPGGTIHVDILKLPHHGSARNVVGSLLERVLADTYIISANGKYGNPDWQTLEWLVDAACQQGRDIRIFATNTTPELERLLVERPPHNNHYTLTVMGKGVSSVEL